MIISRSIKFIEELIINGNVEISFHPEVEDFQNAEATENEPEMISKEKPRLSERKTKGKPPERLEYLEDAAKNTPENFRDLENLDLEE